MSRQPADTPDTTSPRSSDPDSRDVYAGFAPDLLRDRVALVTGGGSGIGRATAVALAGVGARVVVFGRRKHMLDDCTAEIDARGGHAQALAGDTRNLDEVERALDEIQTRFGRLDILVNAAGGQFVAAARDITHKGFEAVIRNNLIASWQVTRACADRFLFEHGGKVVFVTAAHRTGMRGFAHTAAARAGVSALMKSLAAEWAEYGINLNAVAPGTIEVAAMAQYPIPSERWAAQRRNLFGRLGRPTDVANTIVFLVSPMADFITGEEWYVDAGETLNLAHDTRELIDPALFARRARADDPRK